MAGPRPLSPLSRVPALSPATLLYPSETKLVSVLQMCHTNFHLSNLAHALPNLSSAYLPIEMLCILQG